MNVAEAIAQLGIDHQQVPGDLCIVRFDANRKPVHYRYDEVANAEITDDVYLASGAFVPGAVSRHQGRTRENVVRVLWLAIDCDLTDYLSITKNELYEWSDGDLITGAKAMGTDLAEIMDLLGVPLHRLDYTGYGICGYIYLGDHAQDDVPTIDAIYKELVSRINAVWSGPLTESAPRKIADSSVSDAGSRFNRLVPCPNTKGGKKRYGSTLWFRPGRIELADLDATIERRARNTVGRVIPRTGSALDEATQQDIANLLRTHWREGSRHAIALYASGILAKAGISQDQATAIIAAAADGDPELNDRIRAVETSYARARTGLETRGLYGLREWLPVEAVEWIDRTLDDVRPRNAEFTITASEQGRDDQTVGEQAPKHGPVGAHLIPISPLPTSVLSGIIGNYVDLMRPTTEASDGYHYAVGMTVVGAMIGRRVSVSYGSQMFANLNSLLVGASGQARKDTAIKRGTRMLTTPTIAGMRQYQSGVQIVTDVASAEGLIKALTEFPNILLYLTEFSKLMANAAKKGTSTIAPVLMEAFDTPPVISNNSLANPLQAKYPYLSIISATQPLILEGLMSDQYVHSGFINRWFIAPGHSERPISWPVVVDEQALSLLFLEIHNAIHLGFTDGQMLTLATDAREFWDQWYVDEWNSRRNDDESSMRSRVPVLVIKFALIYAVLNGDHMITVEHLQRSISALEWSWSYVRQILPSWGGTTHGKIEARIRQLLTENGPMKRRELTQYCRARTWGVNDYHGVLEALVRNMVVSIDQTGIVSLRND